MGTATIPRGGGSAAPAKGFPNQPGNPNEIKPFTRPKAPPPAQPPPAQPPPSSEIRPFQRPSAPPAAAPQNEIRPFQRAPVPSAPQQSQPPPVPGGTGMPRGRLAIPINTSGTDNAFQSGLDSAKSRMDELDRLYPPLDPSKSKYSPEYARNPPPGGGANWYDDLERRGTLERAKEAAKRTWDSLWNPSGFNPKPKAPIQHPPEEINGPPQGATGVLYDISYDAMFNGSLWFSARFQGVVGPWTTYRIEGGTGVNGDTGILDALGNRYRVAEGGIDGKQGRNRVDFTIKSALRADTKAPDIDPNSVPTPTPIDFGLMPGGYPAPNPLRPPQASPAPRPFPRSPQPSPPPQPKRAPRTTPAPAPTPTPDAPPRPGPYSPSYPSPGPSPAAPGTGTTTSPNISPRDGKEKAPTPDPKNQPDPPKEPEMNCGDPCLGAIQEAQKEAQKEQEKKKPVPITVQIFKDCEGENGAARFDSKQINVPADEAENFKLLYQQIAAANALECRLDLSVAVPEEQIRRRPKSLPEMVLFFETVRKQPNGKRSNYSLTVFHWNKPRGVKPSIPNHTKGNHVKIVILTDGSRLSTSGKSKQEANKIMVAVLRNVPNELKKGRGFTTKYTTSFNSKNKEVEVRCVRGKYYKSGYQPGIKPDWIIEYQKRRTTRLD